jgi:tryptophanyl-tRNA synthetase
LRWRIDLCHSFSFAAAHLNSSRIPQQHNLVPVAMEASQSESAETVLKVAEATGEQAISTPIDDDGDDDNQVVTPWEVTGMAQVNYAKLVDQFGCKCIDAAHVARIARLTSSPPHRFLRRGIFFAHR